LKFGTGKQIAIVLGLFAAGLATACSSDSTDNPTTGGSTTTGSTSGGTTGARSTTGGSTGTTGSSASNSTGGSTSTTGGTGGVTGGTTGGDAGTIVGTPLYTFDTGVQGFAKNTYAPATILDNDASAVLSWDMTAGNPTPGSLKLEIPFSGLGQQVDYQVGMSGFSNFSCKKLHVLVREDSGSTGLFVQPYVLSAKELPDGAVPGDSYVFVGTTLSISAANGAWADYVLDLSAVTDPNFDSTHIRVVGFQIQGPGRPTGDAAAPANPTAATVHVDSFSLETVAGCNADGGTTGGGTTTSGGTTGGTSDGGARDGGTTGTTGGGTSDGGATTGTTGGGTTGTTGDGGATTGTTGGGTTGTTAVVDAGTAG